MCVGAQTLFLPGAISSLFIDFPLARCFNLKSGGADIGMCNMSFLTRSSSDGTGVNRLLAMLPKNEYKRLLPGIEDS